MTLLRTLFAGLSLFVTSGSSSPVMAEDWPEFRGPSQNGVAAAPAAPIRWSPTENIDWRQAIPGGGWSSPVLRDGRIYLTTAVGSASSEPDGEATPDSDRDTEIAAEGTSLRVIALDAADGSVIWNVEALQPLAEQVEEIHQKNSLASPTVVIDGDRLIAHFGHMGTAALDLEGNVLWRQTGLGYSPVHGTGSSPAIVDDLVVISCDGDEDPCLAALDRETGRVRWKTARSGSDVDRTFSFCTPQAIEVEGRKQIISPASGYVAAYAPADGAELWRVDYGGGFSVVPRPVYAEGLLYVCTGFMRANLLAIDPAGASGDVSDSHVVWRHEKGVPTTPSVLVADGLVYFVSDRGVATCLDAQTGEQHWTERLGGGFSASPVLIDGRLYFTNEAGVTYVVRAGREYELLAENDLADRTLASPAVSNGALLMRTEGWLWRIAEVERL